MTEQAKDLKTWNVMVTLDTTMTAIIPVQAEDAEQAGDIALQRDTVVANQSKFETDIDNFYNWAGDAYLPDPDGGIELQSESGHGGDAAKAVYTDTQLEILGACSSAYDPDETIDLARCVRSGDDVDDPEQTTDGFARAIAAEFRDVLRGESDENTISSLKSAVMKMRDQLWDVLIYLEDREYLERLDG